MTIIAWDGQYVAADGLACSGNMAVSWNAKKISIVDDVVYAMSGMLAFMDRFISWHRAGADSDTLPKISDENHCGLLVFCGDKCLQYVTDFPYADEMIAPTAWGCGRDFAVCAMDYGASAAQAVRLAVRRDIRLGGQIQIVNLHDLDKGVYWENVLP